MPPEVCPACRGQRRLLITPLRFAGGPDNYRTCEVCRGSGDANPLPQQAEGEQA